MYIHIYALSCEVEYRVECSYQCCIDHLPIAK